MEKDQLDSLATVAVGSEKMPSAHSHYAASEVYSASESPPAYTRPLMKSTAVQIARIIATTMIAISVIIGSFILASAWLEARATCTPESIALMQAQMNLQQPQNEYIKHPQPEALIQDREVAKDNNLQSLSASLSLSDDKDEAPADTKDIKIVDDKDEKSKDDNDNGDQNDSDEDYDDSGSQTVYMKFPLQLDVGNLAGTLLQQASRNTLSCIVEHRKSNEENDNELDRNKTEHQIGEHVAIICESGFPRQEQQDQEMLMPIIVPLGTVQIPLQSQDGENDRYQIHSQYQASEPRRIPMPMDTRGMPIPFPMDILPPELRNIAHQVSVEMGPPPRMIPQQHMMPEYRQTIEMRHMRPVPMPMAVAQMDSAEQFPKQDQFIQEQQQPLPMGFAQPNRPSMMNPQQQPHGMMPPPPPPPASQSQFAHESQERATEPALTPIIDVRVIEQKKSSESQEEPDRFDGPARGFPFGIRRIMNRLPIDLNNIFQRITDRVRSVQSIVPEGIRREQVQTSESLPEGMQSIPIDPFARAFGIRNLIERGNIEGQRPRSDYEVPDAPQDAKPFPSSEARNDDDDGPVPAGVMNFIHQIVQGSSFPVSGFAVPSRSMDTMGEAVVEAQAQVTDNQGSDEESREQKQQASNMPQQEQRQPRMMVHEEIQNEANHPHLIQPRSVRSVPNNPFEQPKKGLRNCDCKCAC